ncbi:hypothetical protein AB0H92_49290 [Streptomyces phaeochromogenes]|uniref:hypothetical protein n=1 Tax=Streptomyces phaeochromogenes TaxID=1923 RepID=UPI0033F342B2
MTEIAVAEEAVAVRGGTTMPACSTARTVNATQAGRTMISSVSNGVTAPTGQEGERLDLLEVPCRVRQSGFGSVDPA